uniref:Transferrin receptor protein 1-like n=1 Tax=Petromyzon marinus TaxID=7757 RepID=A0AAJ7WK37_PETMA|nr:transferrin receptor protein 1-like [Petromyzon marinus]
MDRSSYWLSELAQRADWHSESENKLINDRLLQMELSMLSRYSSQWESPFRHALYGSGPLSLPSILGDIRQLAGGGEGARGARGRGARGARGGLS